MVRVLDIHIAFRPKELRVLERGTIRHTLWVDFQENKIGINKKREIHHQVVVLVLKREDVIFNFFPFLDNWSTKAIRRNTEGTGRMKYLKHIHRR